VSAAAAARAAWFEPAASPAALPLGQAAADAAVAAARSHAAARSAAAGGSHHHTHHTHQPPSRRRARAGPAPPHTPAVRRLADLPAFRLAASNRLALAFDPLRDGTPMTVGVEIFDPGHTTPRHTHPTGHELFFVLAGTGTGWCDGNAFRLAPGDVAIFPPGCLHGLDADPGGPPLACLELLAPNDEFAERVRSGELTGRLADEEICALAAVGCG
jgi:quercetin dioxygenase-like cupin family protein